jgi:hypothetical protein
MASRHPFTRYRLLAVVAGMALAATCLGARVPAADGAPGVAHTLLAVLKAVMLAGVITATPTRTTDITIWRR